MPEGLRAYIAGFLDGDGCIMAQLVKRSGYRRGYQIRLSIVFYQKKQNVNFLHWLRKQLKFGYIRIRNDQMAEYTIVGIKPVKKTLILLVKYLRLKKQLANLVLKISEIPRHISIKEYLKYCKLVDETANYTYSKRRKITTKDVIEFLDNHKV